MKRISSSGLSAIFGMLILFAFSCSKDAPVVPAPLSGTVQTGPRAIPSCGSCGGANSQSPNSPRISIEVTSADWIDKGNGLYVFDLEPRIGKLAYHLWDYYPNSVQIAPATPDALVLNQGNAITYRWGNLRFINFELDLQTSSGVLPPTFNLELELELN